MDEIHDAALELYFGQTECSSENIYPQVSTTSESDHHVRH